MTAEHDRLAEATGRAEDDLFTANPWYEWGPYLSERAWGTVREDYSADGNAWDYFPHDHARSRAYRWNEDGMAGISDIRHQLCLALALWNGADPILKERMFGLTGPQGNHAEDVKEYWWYLDGLPSHALLRWRYHYPQAAYPYQALLDENRRRGRHDPEYELLDTGVFDDDRYWVVEVTYAKASPTDVLVSITAENMGPDPAVLHVLPTLWFRNTWAWDGDEPVASLARDGDAVAVHHPGLDGYRLEAAPGPGGAAPTALFCDNETNTVRLYGGEPVNEWPKDGINDHVVHGAATVNPAATGTKAAWWYRLDVPGRGRAEVRLRLHRPEPGAAPPAAGLGRDGLRRRSWPSGRRRPTSSTPRCPRLRSTPRTPGCCARPRPAWCGASRCTPTGSSAGWRATPPTRRPRPGTPPAATRPGGTSTPSTCWPCPTPGSTRGSRPGTSPSTRWPGPTSTPPSPSTRCWCCCGSGSCTPTAPCRPTSGASTTSTRRCTRWPPSGCSWSTAPATPLFLERVFQKLLLNFTWWLNRQDADGNNLFGGGFLGLDNISPVDRSHLPPGVHIDQADGTAWMAYYSLAMLVLAVRLAQDDEAYEDMVVKFLEQFVMIADALAASGLYDPADGFFYDRLVSAAGATPLRVQTLVGAIPILPVAQLPLRQTARVQRLSKRFNRHRQEAELAGDQLTARLRTVGEEQRLLVSLVSPDQLATTLASFFAEDAFLSPHGLRSVSKRHSQPYEVPGVPGAVIEYEPAESHTDMYGGNSNWRGPVWFPVNYLVVRSLQQYHAFLGDDYTVEYPTGSGARRSLGEVADDLQERLLSIWRPGPGGRRPVYGEVERLQTDPAWKDNLMFFEYFHGDTGCGLGAMHQTGWTALVVDLLLDRPEYLVARALRDSGTQRSLHGALRLVKLRP